MNEILTPEEVAALFRVNPSWVYEKSRRRCKDPLPVHRIGKYLRFHRAEVLEWFGRTSNVGKKKRSGTAPKQPRLTPEHLARSKTKTRSSGRYSSADWSTS